MSALTWMIVSLAVIAVVLPVLQAVKLCREEESRAHSGSQQECPAGLTGSLTGSWSGAEGQPADIVRHREELIINDLDPVSRTQFDEDWLIVQSRFVDDPPQAVDEADGLVTAVMRVRGYPVDDFEGRAWLMAADHADVVEHYRQARAARTRHLHSGRSDVEDLRRAFAHYRTLYGVLSGRPEDRVPDPETSSGTAAGSDSGALPDPAARPPSGMD